MKMNNTISQHNDIILVSNQNSKAVTERVAELLAQLLGTPVTHKHIPYKEFSNSEADWQFHFSVRGKNVYIINDAQWGTKDKNNPSINDNLMQALLQTRAFKEEYGANKVIVTLPFFPYSRQDKKEQKGIEKKDKRVPGGYRLVNDMMTIAWADKLITFDVHNIAEVGNIESIKIPIGWLILKALPEIPSENIVFSTTDVWGNGKLGAVANDLQIPHITADKKKDYSQNSIVEEVKILADKPEYQGKNVVIYDDMIDTASTLCKIIDKYAESGVKDQYLITTHILLNKNALELLQERYEKGSFKMLFTTNTIAHELLEKYPWIRVFDIAPILANTIHSIETDSEIDYMNDSLPKDK